MRCYIEGEEENRFVCDGVWNARVIRGCRGLLYSHSSRCKSSEEALQNLTGRYEAIGGISPLSKITKAQAHKLTDSMNKMFTEYEFVCYLGLKHIARFRSFI